MQWDESFSTFWDFWGCVIHSQHNFAGHFKCAKVADNNNKKHEKKNIFDTIFSRIDTPEIVFVFIISNIWSKKK
jgi:hypothetical protein